MAQHRTTLDVVGPWSLAISRRFWTEFAPAALPDTQGHGELQTVFLSIADWTRAEASQHAGTARITVSGEGDLAAAADQVCRFLSLDVDARDWPDVGVRDQVIADAQARPPGLRPCGFHSPYEAAVWSVLSQRIRIQQAARLRDLIVERHGDGGAFPSPQVLRDLDLDLPGRKAEYLHAVADAALDGVLGFDPLRSVDPDEAIATVQQVKGFGPFAAELVVVRGASAPERSADVPAAEVAVSKRGIAAPVLPRALPVGPKVSGQVVECREATGGCADEGQVSRVRGRDGDAARRVWWLR